MLKALKGLAGGRETSGALSGKQVVVGSRTVKVDKVLGEGGFATIYRCTDVDTGDVLAIKHFVLTGYPDAARDADTEVAVMERLQGCPHVVRLHEASVTGPSGAPTAAYVLMDFCPNTLVAFLQQRPQPLDNVTLMHIFLPICRAVEAMHCLVPPLAHRDIKAENVLLGPKGCWVLCDFGSACARHGVMESARDIALEEEVVRRYTTPAYRAPELYDLFAREYIGPPVDIWALGVLLYLLAFGKLLFEGEAKLQVLNGRYTLPEGRPEPLRALLRSMLTVSPRQRPDIHQVIARLVDMVPADVAQHMPGVQTQPQPQQAQQKEQQQQPQQAQMPPAAGRASGSSAPAWQHERAPSQGWAEFSDSPSALPAASVGSSDSAAAFQRHQSGSSGSWATFSPKKDDESAAAAGMAAAATAGSFWSSFGDDPPSEGAGLLDQPRVQQEDQQPLDAPWPAAPPAPSLQPAAAAVTAASTGAARPALSAIPPHPPELTPSGTAPQACVPEAAEVSPLSAGLARMSLAHRQPGGPERKTNQPAAAASNSAVSASLAEHKTSAGDGVLRDLEALRQHCVVLEQLLDARNGEVRQLRELTQQQAEEVSQLRLRVQLAEQRAQQASSAVAQNPAAAALTTVGSGSSSGTPSSSRLGRDLRLQVSDSDGSGGGKWVSFSPAASLGAGDAPTPTLLQPAGVGGFKGDTKAPANSSAPQPSAGVSVRALEASLRAKPAGGSGGMAGGASSSLSSSPGAEQLNGMMAKADSSERAPQLRSYPVALTPNASPLSVGAHSAPASAKPSPARIGSSSHLPAHGTYSPMQPSSPMRSRPAPAVASRQSTSPSKHRRHGTAPTSGFFEDLNPLG